MENIEESQNATVITGNTKLMMRIAGVLFAVLAVIQIARNFNPENIRFITTIKYDFQVYYYINIAFLLVVEILFSIASIIQKKVFFLISCLIVIGLFLTRIVYSIIMRAYIDRSNLCLTLSFIIIFLLFIAQQKNNRKLITVGKCVFAIPLIAYMALQYQLFIDFF